MQEEQLSMYFTNGLVTFLHTIGIDDIFVLLDIERKLRENGDSLSNRISSKYQSELEGTLDLLLWKYCKQPIPWVLSGTKDTIKEDAEILGLSTRAKTALRRGNMSMTEIIILQKENNAEKGLLSIRNIGIRSVNEILLKLGIYNDYCNQNNLENACEIYVKISDCNEKIRALEEEKKRLELQLEFLNNNSSVLSRKK